MGTILRANLITVTTLDKWKAVFVNSYPAGVYSTRNINKLTLLHQVGISNYFMRKMHGKTTLNSPSILEKPVLPYT